MFCPSNGGSAAIVWRLVAIIKLFSPTDKPRQRVNPLILLGNFLQRDSG
jgi:hypothetical protein